MWMQVIQKTWWNCGAQGGKSLGFLTTVRKLIYRHGTVTWLSLNLISISLSLWIFALQYFRLQQFFKAERLNSLKDFNNSLTCFIGMSEYILLFTCDLLPLVPTVPRVNICAVGCREMSQTRTALIRRHSSPSPSLHCHPSCCFCACCCGSVPRSWSAYSLRVSGVLERARQAHVALTTPPVLVAARCIFFA